MRRRRRKSIGVGLQVGENLESSTVIKNPKVQRPKIEVTERERDEKKTRHSNRNATTNVSAGLKVELPKPKYERRRIPPRATRRK